MGNDEIKKSEQMWEIQNWIKHKLKPPAKPTNKIKIESINHVFSWDSCMYYPIYAIIIGLELEGYVINKDKSGVYYVRADFMPN